MKPVYEKWHTCDKEWVYEQPAKQLFVGSAAE